jgi:DNA-3-methyladenine glycosylase
MDEITPAFFERHPVECARDLIGAVFRWQDCSARIVETEAYAAEGDEACHTFFRPGARRFVAGHPPGTAYVYLNYGVHWLFNVLAKGPGMSGFVLFRALEPLVGIENMVARRGRPALFSLCSGPGKLTAALGIDGLVHGSTFLGGTATGITRGRAGEIAEGPRIGITRAKELPWRFHEKANPLVSR